eukprot:CAMPEP_0203749900 /NCGR_PEP_ID=MMETSP0098-20131031/4271_1 /ASSEMBLY_ACC=CAM_ASM_000208 /TAXON_ID=96639 /ORGANISM=" , Strain NY0313808BC1" /LENGTH=338 /DNA_ID=CAMNT_0050639019 /DNA_START=20 /DNA_END=1036 /DNA_ORIENTATION=+
MSSYHCRRALARVSQIAFPANAPVRGNAHNGAFGAAYLNQLPSVGLRSHKGFCTVVNNSSTGQASDVPKPPVSSKKDVVWPDKKSMGKNRKKRAAARKKAQQAIKGKTFSFDQGLALCRHFSKKTFNEVIDIEIGFNLDPRKSDQIIRTAIPMPFSTGKLTKIAVFAEGELADEALEAGADFVGTDDLATYIREKKRVISYSHILSTQDSIFTARPLGKILGPRGLMPNPKEGTLTNDIGEAVRRVKKGMVILKIDGAGYIRTGIARVNSPDEEIHENFRALMMGLRDAKPSGSKGRYITSAKITSTMGLVGIPLDVKFIDPSSSSFMKEKTENEKPN